MNAPDLLDEVTHLVIDRVEPGRRLIVGLTGSVAVGKSAFAAALRRALSTALPDAAVEVVSTDSFLFPNAELDARGLTMQKGSPASFDVDAMATFLRTVRSGMAQLSVPVYDHFTYDIVEGALQQVAAPDLLIIEGLSLLSDPVIAGALDLSIYLDATHADIERWHAERFVANASRATDEPGGFWDLFAGLTSDQLSDAATFTWNVINLPNLLNHIEPTRSRADVVVNKGGDHHLRSVAVQAK